MITFALCLIALIAIVTIVLTTIGVVGGALLAIFGDLIVFGLCIWIICKIVKMFRKKK